MQRCERQEEEYLDRRAYHHARWGNAVDRLRACLDEDDCNYAYFDGLQQRCEALYSRCAGAEEDMANYAEAVDHYIA